MVDGSIDRQINDLVFTFTTTGLHVPRSRARELSSTDVVKQYQKFSSAENKPKVFSYKRRPWLKV